MDELQMKVEKLREKFVAGYPNWISVDEGWYQIIVDCDAAVAAIDPGYRIEQIKEKFGGLRYYVRPSDPAKQPLINKVISDHEQIALRTCEATGRPGVLMRSPGGWFKTLDPEYAAETLHYARYAVYEPEPFRAPVARRDRATDF